MAGEYKVRMGLASVPCADGGISWAMAGGGDEAAIAHDGGKGGMRKVMWGGCWCSCSAREGGTRWWWIGVAWCGDWHVCQAKVEGTRWWRGLLKWWGCWLNHLARVGDTRCWGKLMSGWLGLAMVVGGAGKLDDGVEMAVAMGLVQPE